VSEPSDPGIAPGELRRFARKFGAEALLDRAARRFGDRGLAAASLDQERWLAKMVDEPLLLRQPLVRWEQQLTVGDAEPTWRSWTGR